MLLALTTTHRPATDLGYLLAKNPVRPQSFSLSFGKAHVFYPEATPERCTVALLLEVDPVGLVRNRRGSAGHFRHRDHRFEWTRTEFQAWANCVATCFGYGVRFLPVGPEEPAVGSPTQMGVFERK